MSARNSTAGSGPFGGGSSPPPSGKAPSTATRKAAAQKTRKAAGTAPGGARRTRLRERAAAIYAGLEALYPDAHCELDFGSPFELLVATILSAQCTDKRVNMVTPTLFARFPDAQSLASAPQDALEDIIRSTGFFRTKARALIGMSKALVEQHGGHVPPSMAELVVLPGVGRKTANVILGNAFARNEGVVVDTHVGRLSVRLGLTRAEDPVKVERELMALFPPEQWTMLSHLLIWHGRRICDARRPRCGECALLLLCPLGAKVMGLPIGERRVG